MMCGRLAWCKTLTQQKNTRKHDNVSKYIPFRLCAKYNPGRTLKWYTHNPEGFTANNEHKSLWYFTIHCGSDIVVAEKMLYETKITDIALSGDEPGDWRELEKTEIYKL